MASDQEVAAQRAKVEAAREAVRQARSAQSTTAREGENDLKVARLTNEEAELQKELARLTGSEAPAAAPATTEAEAPAEAPEAEAPEAEAPETEAPGTSRRGGRNQTEG